MAAALAQHSLHPASRTLVEAFAKEASAPLWHANDVIETPGQGLVATLVNAEAGDQSVALRLGSAAHCGVVRPQTEDSQVFLSDDQGWLATFELQEDVRPDALRTVRALKDSGMAVYLLSGDAPDAAKRVAQQIGITEFKGQCTPQDKLDFLRNLQLSGCKVAMVGDGLNDGPVLAGAHASFAFGRAVPLAQAQADFLVSGQRLSDVAWACDLAQRTLAVVRQNLWWAAGYNAVAVPLAVAGFMPAWAAGIGMASSSLLVVLNAVRLSKDQTMPRAD
jgi:Cu2+-exporting ATPase